jgi:hypothetical protein
MEFDMRNRKYPPQFVLDLGVEGIGFDELRWVQDFIAEHVKARPGRHCRIKYDGLDFAITDENGRLLPEVTAAVGGYLIGRKAGMALTSKAA